MTTSTTTHTNGYRHDSDPPQTVEFLKLLWGNGDQSGKILIWSLNTKRSLWLKTPSQAARFQSQPNIFTGMAKSADVERSPTERTLASDAYMVPGFWLDVDYGNSGHERRNLPPTEADALELIAAIPWEPTAIISSGHGRHCYYLFPTPLKLATDDKRQEFAELIELFQSHVKALAAKRGWWIDSTADLARVMRLPGTINTKSDPVPCEIIKSDGPRKRIDWWVDTLKGVETPTQPATAQNGRSGATVGELTLDPDVNLGDWFDLMCEAKPEIRDVFEHRKKLNDESLSAYDLSLASHAAIAGRPDQQIADIIIVHRRRHGNADDIEKGLRGDYIVRTIAKAKADAPITESQLAEKTIDQVLANLRAPIKRIVEFVGDNGIGELHFENNDGEMIPVGDLTVLDSATKFRNAVIKATRTAPRPLAKTDWVYSDALLDAVEVLRPGDPGHWRYQTRVDETKEWLAAYFGHTQLVDYDRGDDPPSDAGHTGVGHAAGAFKRDGKHHLFFHDFRQWVNEEYGVPVTHRSLTPRLEEVGMIHGSIRLDGKKKRVWKVDADVADKW